MRKSKPLHLSCPATFSGEKTGPRNFEGIAYSGGVVTDHPWFSRVAFDLASTTFDTPAPALYKHGEPVGVIQSSVIEKEIKIAGQIFSDSDEIAKGIADKADRGMPWQLSVGIWPGDVDEIGRGKKVQLNGRTLEGPLTIFRNNRIRETSFVALGADAATAAQIFEAREGERNMEREQELQQEVDALKAKNVALEAEKKAGADKAAALQEQFEASRRATRTEAVKTLFSAIGREFKEDDAKPYVEMSDEAFSAVSKDLAKKPALPAHLSGEQATHGAGEIKGTAKIMDAAQQFIAAQAALGRTVSVSDAVTHVTAEAKKAA
ncbi:MAG: hypothetical protein IPP91_11270 [Betaproteobacteria bacterium]|nr:hypothetical protein [Betaproteobacteria bacterium]